MFLKEGGAGGHMQHPFDLPDVKTGEDLKDFFDQAAEVVKKSQAVKIDGVNVSFKLISDRKDRKEFAVDRGSTKPIDIEGISIDRVGERFPEGHGMRPAIKTLLSIFNEALPKIEPELKKLGMWGNPTIFLNTEYVSETTNVTEYDHSFLAIHGVNQFYEKTNSRTGVQRPGLVRPDGLKDPSVEVLYDPLILQKLADKVRPIAEKYDFEVYTTVPTSFKKEAEIDFKNTLEEPFTVVFDEEDEITKSLGDWLKEVDNPRHIFITRPDGKKIGALSKEVYTTILDGKPIISLVRDEEDVMPAIAGAVFYHATRVLGNDILNALTSPMGDVMNHEGVVIRHKKFGQKPVKITGEFILGGMRTNFQESKEYSENFINEVLDVFLEKLGQEKKIVLYPGRFQPMGKHHLEVFRKLEKEHGVGNVYIITSNNVKLPKSPLNFEEKKQIMLRHGIPEEQILFAESPYRGQELDKYFDPSNTIAVYAVGKKDMDEDPRFSNLDGVTKSGSPAWYKSYEKNKDNLEAIDKHGYVAVAPHVCITLKNGDEMCGTSIRNAMKNLDEESFEDLMGWFDQDIYDMIQNKISESPRDLSELISLKKSSDKGENESFDKFMEEYRRITPQTNPFDPRLRVWYMGKSEESDNHCLVQTEMRPSSEYIYLASIHTTPRGECESKGYASKVMNTIIEMADTFGVAMALNPVPFGSERLGVKDLENWYYKAGFRQDQDIGGEWVRKPNKPMEPLRLSEAIFSLIEEVYSERQRDWACSQIDDPDELTKPQAEEMCSSKIKEEEELEELKTGAGDSGVYSNTPGPPKANCRQCCKQCNCSPKPRRPRASFSSDDDPFEFDPIEETSGAGAAGGYSLPLGQKPKRFNSPRPKVKGIKIYTRRSKGN